MTTWIQSGNPLRYLTTLILLVLPAHGAIQAAPPQITKVSQRGLQSGTTTALVIEGSDLGPRPRLILPIEQMTQQVKPGASANRVEIAVTVPATASPGIYHLRLTTDQGISNPVPIAIDDLPQLLLGTEAVKIPVALHGTLVGNATVKTSFAGKKGQRIVIDVEARRLGSPLDPIVEVYDARHVPLGWSHGQASLSGDARVELTLPGDGIYSVELRDILYKAADASFFRLKIGELHYADLVFPMGVQRGTNSKVQLLGNTPGDVHVMVDARKAFGDLPAPLPHGRGLSGRAPRVVVTEFPEVVEGTEASPKAQEVTVPAIINGRISARNEEDRYRLLVKPGMKLQFDVMAERIGAKLDGVLAILNEAGNQLAGSDDRADTIDPGLEFTVPDKVNVLVVSLKDLIGRGGPDYVYRLAVIPAGRPDFSLSLLADRLHVPQGGSSLLRIRANRAGYNGPIQLSVLGLPSGVDVSGQEIPAGATDTLLTLTAPADREITQAIATIIGESPDANIGIRRPAMAPPTPVSQVQPWLRSELGVAVVPSAGFQVAWDSTEPGLPLGGTYPAKVKVVRPMTMKGPVRLTLLTSQVVPTVGAPPQPVKPDLTRALRLQAATTIGADQEGGIATVVVPANLPVQPYDLAIQAELLSADGKQVLASAITPSRRFQPVKATPPPDKASGGKPFAIFEDQEEFITNLTEGSGQATLEGKDKYSGKASVKVTPDQRFNPALPGLGLKIREKPGSGEYRYLRFAWKKKGGETICLQINHDGQWGPTDNKPAKFRFHAGPGPECFGASDRVAKELPGEWVVVTRDLFADYGEFTFTGIALSPIDGEYALFDHIYLARAMKDFEEVKPK